MTIDKLYSKKYLLIKTVYAVLLPFLTELFAMLFNPENALVFVFFVMFFHGVFYALPFTFTFKVLRREALYKNDKISSFILMDLLYILLPGIISTIICDSIFLILDTSSQGQGVFSVLVISIIVLITLVFWLLYVLFRKKH